MVVAALEDLNETRSHAASSLMRSLESLRQRARFVTVAARKISSRIPDGSSTWAGRGSFHFRCANSITNFRSGRDVTCTPVMAILRASLGRGYRDVRLSIPLGPRLRLRWLHRYIVTGGAPLLARRYSATTSRDIIAIIGFPEPSRDPSLSRFAERSPPVGFVVIIG